MFITNFYYSVPSLSFLAEITPLVSGQPKKSTLRARQFANGEFFTSLLKRPKRLISAERTKQIQRDFQAFFGKSNNSVKSDVSGLYPANQIGRDQRMSSIETKPAFVRRFDSVFDREVRRFRDRSARVGGHGGGCRSRSPALRR